MISVLALLFVVMMAVQIVVHQHVLLPSFAELERDDARISMKRIEYVLKSTLDSVQLTAADWGNWSDVYRFVQTRSADFIRANLTPVAMNQLKANALLIVDRGGNVLVARTYDLDSGASMNLDLAAAKRLPDDFPWRRNLADGTPAQGLVRTNQGIMMLAGAPVLDGSGRGPALGMVLIGKLLNTQQLRLIGEQAQASFAMTPLRGVGGSDRLVETDSATRVLRPYSDIYGTPLMSFQVGVARKITERGRGALAYASACLIVAGVAALILAVIVLNRAVLVPLARVTRHAVQIGQGADLTVRLDLPGGDEVALLAREFDRMVERVAESRRQLMDRSFDAGFAELAKGVLHNLGNAMTPLLVRLSNLGERLREAPAADVELASSELARESPDSPRHADLQEFLRLGCREMTAALSDAQADVTVIQRQTLVVQSALNELMHSTRNEHVVEPVRLPDLVLQTLEIVPDACRQRLVVEADDSLRRVGVVKVARTVLRLVLQNLIINAADAVRDAGRAQGVFRVAAEIVHGSDRTQLHLHCSDDGVGIAEDNLERVFEHGFSTKARDANHGIGLNWCANAITALGGRIWAASDGPGRGASLHLLLPLASHSVT